MSQRTTMVWPMRGMPLITVAGRFGLDDRAFDTRYLASTHALHVHDYPAHLRLGKCLLAIRPGDLTLTPSGIPSWYDLPTPGFHLCIHFKGGSTPGEHVKLPLQMPLGPNRTYVAERILHIARLVARSHGRGGQIAAAAAAAALQELLLHIAMLAGQRRTGSRPLRAESAVEQAASILQERFAENLTMADVAAEVNLSRNYLAQHFRRRFGMTVGRYLLTRRIERARQLLSLTDLPIGKIGQRVGLTDPQYFNKQFRRVTGQSPSAARVSEEDAQ